MSWARRLIQFEKVLIWIVLIGIILLLRHLFSIFFLTFILAYIGNTAVNRMTGRLSRRRVSLVVFYFVLILSLVGVAILIIPKMFFEARQLARAYIIQDIEEEKEAGLEPVVTDTLTSQSEPEADAGTVIDRQTKRYLDSAMVQILGQSSFDSFSRSESYRSLINRVEKSVAGVIPRIVEGVRHFVNSSLIIALHFLLSIMLSFLILWDLPAMRVSIGELSTGRTAEIYTEIVPSFRAFGIILGRAFEAQTGIAIINTILTAIGLMILGVPSIALLATIVFFCSYIPVFGVFLSSLPAALLAFKTGGIHLVFGLVIMVLIVHAVEAYMMNPLIYGRQLKLHPVLVLIILLIGEHLAGVWGLLLGVPLMAFFVKYVIRGEQIS